MERIFFAYPSLFFVTIAIIFASVANCIGPGNDFSETYLERQSHELAFFFAVVIAPFIETIIFQGLPFIVIRKLLGRDVYKVGLMSLFFGILHFSKIAPVLSILNGLAGGVLLAYCYVFYVKKSYLRALLMTTFVHAAHNFIILLF